eukprot:m.59233 g.59233  ORF g.59233 m.59233 type:complete len:438 (-) comp11230_c0_seq1:124-1437(-)
MAQILDPSNFNASENATPTEIDSHIQARRSSENLVAGRASLKLEKQRVLHLPAWKNRSNFQDHFGIVLCPRGLCRDGAIVTSIEPKGIGARYGMRSGDVIERVNSMYVLTLEFDDIVDILDLGSENIIKLTVVKEKIALRCPFHTTRGPVVPPTFLTDKTEARLRNLGAVTKAGSLVPLTTRKIREGETNGRDYFFITPALFKALVTENWISPFIEKDGDFYGVLVNPERGPCRCTSQDQEGNSVEEPLEKDEYQYSSTQFKLAVKNLTDRSALDISLTIHKKRDRLGIQLISPQQEDKPGVFIAGIKRGHYSFKDGSSIHPKGLQIISVEKQDVENFRREMVEDILRTVAQTQSKVNLKVRLNTAGFNSCKRNNPGAHFGIPRFTFTGATTQSRYISEPDQSFSEDSEEDSRILEDSPSPKKEISLGGNLQEETLI